MGFAVELSFDPVMTADIQSLWRQLSESGISSFMLDVGAEPHISLVVFDGVLDEVDHRIAVQAVKEFAPECRPIEFTLGAVGSFPTTEGVVYLAPVVTQELLDVHARFHALLAKTHLRSHTYYRPGNWIPHCTVAAELPAHKVGTAVELCRSADLFSSGRMESVALVEFRPIVYHVRSTLAGCRRENE